eukprot:scaffold339571_cov38-Prasinocladus_malaysianus.AAC.1
MGLWRITSRRGSFGGAVASGRRVARCAADVTRARQEAAGSETGGYTIREPDFGAATIDSRWSLYKVQTSAKLLITF